MENFEIKPAPATKKKPATPNPYDFETFGAFCTAIVAAGKAHTYAEAEHVARNIIPKEAVIQRKILNYLESPEVTENGFFWKDQAGPYQQKGIPDIVGCYIGRFIAFEVKRPLIGKVSPLQAKAMERIGKACGAAHIVTSVEQVKAIIKEERYRYG